VNLRWIQTTFFLPSFLCLDVPFVTLSWALAVALDSSSNVKTALPKFLLLFFGVWAVYLIDRILDSYRLQKATAITDRHQFAIRFRWLLWTLLAFSAALALLQLYLVRDAFYVLSGVLLAIVTATYFLVFRVGSNTSTRKLPSKELTIAICFAAGVMLTSGTFSLNWLNGVIALGLTSIALFNCLVISYGEADFDRRHDMKAYYARQVQAGPPATSGWIGVTCGCALLLVNGTFILGSSMIIASMALYCLSRCLDRDNPSQVTQVVADGILLIPIPLILMMDYLF
jgi:hypothetical protein